MEVCKPLDELECWIMNELLAAHPDSADVLAARGVDPRTHCHRTASQMMLKRVLG